MAQSTLLPAAADSLARLHTAEAVGTCVDIMRGTALGDPKELRLRLEAAKTIIDRGHGRAVQAVISVPARQAVAAKLASLNDDALLRIAMRERAEPSASGTSAHGEGGVGEQKRGPIGSHAEGGTIQASDEPNAVCDGNVADCSEGEDGNVADCSEGEDDSDFAHVEGELQYRGRSARELPRGIDKEQVEDAEFIEPEAFDPTA